MNYLELYFDDLIKITKPQIKNLIKKRNKIKKYLTKNNFVFLEGSSTFYFFVKLDHYKFDILNLCLYLLLKYNIAVVPGQAYGSSTKKFIRLSIGTETEERIFDSIRIINSILKKGVDQKELEKLMEINDIKKFIYK
jgi:aspartate aminotransferase/aminotransferase